jgi:hypothetical protein
MKWVALSLVAAVVLFVVLEWSAAPPFDPALGATRHLDIRSRYGWKPPEVNSPCRSICEPHCADRWGASSWTFILRRGCFLICIDEACKAR